MDLQGLADEYLISILNGLARGLLLFTLAAGLSLLFGLLDVLNLAHGSFLLLGGYVAVSLSEDGSNFLLACLVALGLGAVLGGGLSISLKPVSGRGHLDQALLTLGVAFILSDLAEIVWGSDFYSPNAPGGLDESVDIFGNPYPAYRLAVVAVGIVIAIAIFFAFERTKFGAMIRATVSDWDMAAAVGVRVRRVSLTVFVVASALATFGGVIGGPVLGVRPGLDIEVLVLALIVVVIGGLGSLKGALIGAILIGQLQSVGVVVLPTLAPFLLFGAMVVILAAKPTGLFGRSLT